MAAELQLWDTAQHLNGIDDLCLYLEAAAEEDPGDGSIIRLALTNIARAEKMGTLNNQARAACEGLYADLADVNSISLSAFWGLANSLGMRIHLELPSDLEKRLAQEMRQDEEKAAFHKRTTLTNAD